MAQQVKTYDAIWSSHFTLFKADLEPFEKSHNSLIEKDYI